MKIPYMNYRAVSAVIAFICLLLISVSCQEKREEQVRDQRLTTLFKPDGYVANATLSIVDGDYERAERLLRESIKINERNAAAYMVYSELYVRRFDEASSPAVKKKIASDAAELLRRARQLVTNYSPINTELASWLLRVDDWDGALAVYNAVFKQSSDDHSKREAQKAIELIEQRQRNLNAMKMRR